MNEVWCSSVISPPTFIDFPHDSELQVLPVVLFAVETQQDAAELRRQPKRWHHIDVTEPAQTGWQLLYCCYSLLWILKTQHVDHWGRGGSGCNKKQFDSSWQCEHVNQVQFRWNQINNETSLTVAADQKHVTWGPGLTENSGCSLLNLIRICSFYLFFCFLMWRLFSQKLFWTLKTWSVPDWIRI